MLTTNTTVAPDVLALELATARAQFDALEQEWNEADTALGILADELKACGQRVEMLERQQTPDPIPGYNLEGGAP